MCSDLGASMLVSILSPVEGCGSSGESVQTRILRHAQDASAPKSERTLRVDALQIFGRAACLCLRLERGV